MAIDSEKMFYSSSEIILKDESKANDISFIDEDSIEQLEHIFQEITANGHYKLLKIKFSEYEKFISILNVFEVLGSIEISINDDSYLLSSKTYFSSFFNLSVLECLKNKIKIFDDWKSFGKTPNSISGSELLLYIEKRRISECIKKKKSPKVFLTRHVAFGLVKAKSRTGKSCYLFEYNKNWNKYNFIGGKEEDSDNCIPENIMLREFEEETGVSRDNVTLLLLNPGQWVDSYSLLGQKGILTNYPAKFFLLLLNEPIPLNHKYKWFTEEEVMNRKGKDGEEFLVSPLYFDFLINHMAGGIKELNFSFPQKIKFGNSFVGFVKEHKILTIATGVIGLMAAIISLIAALLALP